MNLSLFIAQRIRQTKIASFSATVARIGVASIAVGLVVMIVSFAILGGFTKEIRQKIVSFSGHIQVSKFTMNNSYEEESLSIETNLYQNAKKVPLLGHIQVVGHKAGLLKTEDEVSGAIFKGVGRDYDWVGFRKNLVEGDIITFSDTSYSKEVLISRRMANKLRLKVGDEVIMYFVQNPPSVRKLVIKGVYETGLDELDNQLLVGDISLVQKLNKWDKTEVGGYEIFVTDFSRLDEAYEAVDEAMDQDMGGIKITDKFVSVFDWLSLLNRNVVIFLCLILFVASFNMVSILLILMMERTSMIGMLKAVGATNWQIRKIFLYNGFTLIIRGLVLGNVIGLSLCAIQYYYRLVPLDPANYSMDAVPIEWNWPVFLLLNLGTLLLVTTVLIIPTVIITRIQPIKAMTFTK